MADNLALISMAGRINSRALGVAPATLLEYLEGESSEIRVVFARIFTQVAYIIKKKPCDLWRENILFGWEN